MKKLWFIITKPFVKRFDLDIFMKSGNIIVLTDVTEYEARTVSQGTGLSSLNISWLGNADRYLITTSIVISQIEGIVVHNRRGFF